MYTTYKSWPYLSKYVVKEYITCLRSHCCHPYVGSPARKLAHKNFTGTITTVSWWNKSSSALHKGGYEHLVALGHSSRNYHCKSK